MVLKSGEAFTYSDAEVEIGPGNYRVRIRRDGAAIDSFSAADVERWFVETPDARRVA